MWRRRPDQHEPSIYRTNQCWNHQWTGDHQRDPADHRATAAHHQRANRADPSHQLKVICGQREITIDQTETIPSSSLSPPRPLKSCWSHVEWEFHHDVIYGTEIKCRRVCLTPVSLLDLWGYLYREDWRCGRKLGMCGN